MMTGLAIDGGVPLHADEWPSWPPPLSPQQRALVTRVLDSGDWSSSAGPLCDDFAAQFAALHGAAHGIPLVNGTMALYVALRAAGVGRDDEVVIPSYTFVACATSVLMLGATPVIADVDSEHLHLSAETLEEALTARTRAVMVVHLAGSPAPMAEILEVAGRHGLVVVEDSAQAHGAAYRDRPVGALGTLGTFSFQSSKAMTAGEGGLVVTEDEELAERVWSLCNVGRTRGGAWYGHQEIGWNLRMTEMQAALLVPWLEHLEGQIATRDAFVSAFTQRTAMEGAPVTAVPSPEGTTRSSHHLLILRLNATGTVDRDWVVRALAAEGVPVEPGYPHLGRIDAVGAHASVRETPRLDRVAESLLWVRQPMLMAGVDSADRAAEAFTRVLADPRALIR